MKHDFKFITTSFFIFFFTLFILLALFHQPVFAQSKTYTNKLGMRFVLISKGSFLMGSPVFEPGRQWNEKRHKVLISKDFYMGETEVTQGQWEKLVGFNPSSFSKLGKSFPIDTVSWNDCMEFIRVLNKWEATDKYRLPTEAEWEYACRAGSTSAFSNGPITTFSCNEPEPAIVNMAWYCYNSGLASPARDFKPHPVKTKAPNKWGLYDMHGNVQEWVLDSCKWRDILRARVGAVTTTYKNNIVDPLNKTGKHKIIRGGGWYQTSKYQRSAYRSYYKPKTRRNSLGFRIVRMR
ncbi:formylglycine-generating enzyme family protein [Desulfobacula phenolica]|uniref:Formylglycine-generating enzyme, required for sulfatase activity, contains SUMF1/FGE domain n=1 Tax=Desulfobacula phenolica TaxID=90732 RepID=A0A1H2ESV1_9BACT|nr:formylglycine-generating enzyme family protein [Desulfobacula phenolica]SDT98151.1 Formylglycine-generating enzyme, required for sulfatase activity, contains SUMF1/FGE domain [Desulfobacula phenolica]